MEADNPYIILVDTDRNSFEPLQLLIPERVSLLQVSDREGFQDLIKNQGNSPSTLIISRSADDPIQIAQQAHLLDTGIPVLILTFPSQHQKLKQALHFSPFLGSDITLWSGDYDAELGAIFQEMVKRAQQRKIFRGRMAAVQADIPNLHEGQARVTHYLDRLLDRAPVGVVTLNVDRRIVAVNRQAKNLLESTEQELLGQKLLDFFPDDEQKRLQSLFIQSDQNPPVSGPGPEQVYKLITPQNDPLFLEITVAPLSDTPSPQGAIVIFQDVTPRIQAERERIDAELALRNSEKQLRLITDTVPALIGYIDADERYRFNNRAYEDWFGWKREQFYGQHIKDMLGENVYEEIRPHVQSALAGEWVEYESELPIPGGETRFVRGTYVPDRSEDGTTIGFYTLLSDITEQKKNQDQERQRMLEFCHASRLTTIGEMSSQLIHELAQPLGAIAYYGSSCLRLMDNEGLESKELRRMTESIQEQADRAVQIMNRLRRFARKEVTPTTFSLNEFVHGVVHFANIEARETGITILEDLGEGAGSLIADRVLIEQALLNLIRNSIQAMIEYENAGQTITVQTWEDSEGTLHVSVTDSGPGLPDSLLEKLFEPFFTTKKSGTGMGLAITKSIIDSHGGSLTAYNNINKGATFALTLEKEFPPLEGYTQALSGS
ncbi:PAS domain-containing sensor histidine kinase [Thiohalorhabdus sp. Cl-TMA]|uniref:histidine kinase n=1 Tax=Thiohalorhabdus methylotrophus TaxID=3242694 RepID=A0ABV4TVC9_9GAMM